MSKKPLVQLYYKTEVDGTVRKLIPDKHYNVVQFIADRLDRIAQMHIDRRENGGDLPTLMVKQEDWEKVIAVLKLKADCKMIYISTGGRSLYLVLKKHIPLMPKKDDISPVPQEDQVSQK